MIEKKIYGQRGCTGLEREREREKERETQRERTREITRKG